MKHVTLLRTLSTLSTPAPPWHMVVAATSFCGRVSPQQGQGRRSEGGRRRWMEPNAGGSSKQTCNSLLKTSHCRRRFNFQQYSIPKRSARAAMELLRSKHINGSIKAQTYIPLTICGQTWKWLLTDSDDPSDRSGAILPRRMGRNFSVWMWKAAGEIPSKSCSYNISERWFYKVLTWGRLNPHSSKRRLPLSYL